MTTLKKLLSCLMCAVIIVSAVAVTVNAQEKETKYYIGEAVNAGKDTGYSKNSKIANSDPHFGWKLGEFYVGGYTSMATSENGDPIFLKTVGDEIRLYFDLEQDINKLNGKKSLVIYDDKNGYDQYFGIAKTGFGKGTLIIKHTDSEHHASDPIIYTNFLSAKASKTADVEVELLEEGDYEVALNYEVRKKTSNPFDKYKYYNYRIFFRFSVRNGNCMVFPFDAATGSELGNTAFTEHGFYLDLANSDYLDVYVKKEILVEGSSGVAEDTRYNRPVRDGEMFTEEGIYTITATNKYTSQVTVKKIYVGSDPVGKAHVTTGMSVEEINTYMSKGAKVSANGELIFPKQKSNAPKIAIGVTAALAVVGIVLVGGVATAVAVTVSAKKRKTVNGGVKK